MIPNLPFIIFLIILSYPLSPPSSAADLCPTTTCRRTGPTIRFPFRLQNQPTSCGYPGFDLFCDAFNRTLITLLNSGIFTVQSIDYANQNIWLNDPDNCLPKRLLTLNLSGSPFNGIFFQDFTLFNCTLDYRVYAFNPIRCLSGENYTVLASSDERGVRFLAARCGLMATVAVPVRWGYFEPVTMADLSADIRLAWASPRCQRCESRGGRCGFRSENSTVIQCRNVRHDLPKGARYAKIIGIALPIFLCLASFLYFLCNYYINRRSSRRHYPDSMAVAPHPTTTTTVSGLDGPTIESYPKTILGESRRLPKPEDIMCSICLSEYMPKETLRSIPECNHWFHAECIDEWLRLNSSCPICRNSPMSSPLVQDS
ncbi:hypothetical protein CDL12_20289 [Handroanthus impetiginosus]|uniref:RING-type E3 ubiquitin transferase n=1 Tax=Handroanthus impetiginosus TaxID=429701 RepID=A0A2G9GPD2_9LAMI|nr:hypothetical protein CDL12_20289 [Handroanthus impetiginosus]